MFKPEGHIIKKYVDKKKNRGILTVLVVIVQLRKEQTMLWNIDFRDKRPIYEQIVSGMEGEILRGIMTPDEPLPSVRSLAMELSINPNTIQKAYRQMESDGYTYSVPGRGSFVSNVEGVRNMKKQEMIQRIAALIQEAKQLGITDKEITDAVKGNLKGGSSDDRSK